MSASIERMMGRKIMTVSSKKKNGSPTPQYLSTHCSLLGSSSRSTIFKARALKRVSKPRPISFAISVRFGDSKSRWSSGIVRSNWPLVRSICCRTPSTLPWTEVIISAGMSHGALPLCSSFLDGGGSVPTDEEDAAVPPIPCNRRARCKAWRSDNFSGIALSTRASASSRETRIMPAIEAAAERVALMPTASIIGMRSWTSAPRTPKAWKCHVCQLKAMHKKELERTSCSRAAGQCTGRIMLPRRGCHQNNKIIERHTRHVWLDTTLKSHNCHNELHPNESRKMG